jgi:hypothetical protein
MKIHIGIGNKSVKYLNICSKEREGEGGRLVWRPEGEEGGVKEDLQAGGGEGEEGLAGGGQLHRLVQPPQLLHSLGQAAPAQVWCHQLLARKAYTNNKVLRSDETKPEENIQDETGPDRTGPDRTGPDQTRPDQTRPDQTRPDQIRAVTASRPRAA